MTRRLVIPAVLLGFLAGAAPASAHHVACGDAITVDTKLDSDLVGCPGDGLIIATPDVTLDLDGHVISGVGEGAPEGIRAGVYISKPGVVVRYGAIRGFETGVWIDSGHDITVRRMTIFGNGEGIYIGEAGANNATSGVLVRNNVLADNARFGLGMHEAYNVRASRNLALGNGLTGIAIGGEGRSEARYNVASGNGGNGISVKGMFDEFGEVDEVLRNEATGNTATFNVGLGISAGRGTIDGGGNSAFGNGNPLQCLNIVCQ